MSREAKFNFISEDLLTAKKRDSEYKVNINRSGMLYFPRETVNIYDLDKKWFKFYVDQDKKTLGWSLFQEGDIDEFKKRRKLMITETGSGVISIQKCLKALGLGKPDHVMKDLRVRIYAGSYLQEEVQYVKLHAKNPEENQETPE